MQQSRLAQMGEMLSMIAHQWRQPLSSISTMQVSIKMAIELEQYNFNDTKDRDKFLKFLDNKLDKIGNYTNNLSHIISDFSDFYKPHKKSEILKLDAIVLKSKILFEDFLKIAKIDIDYDLNANVEMSAHKNEFMQVILNIVNNAKEQSIEKKIKKAKIYMKTYYDDDYVFLEISDNAGGIDEKVIDNIFDPYFSTKLEKNGTGLGLYMSNVIIKEHHSGEISVKNIKNGVMFTIKIKRFKNNEK